MATETTSDEGKDGKEEDDKSKGTGAGKATESDDDDGDLEKWKALARKHEKETGKLRSQLEKIEAANKTESEKAIDAAKAEAKAEARAELLADMVETALEASAGDKLADPSFVRLIDADTRETFIDKDGKIDKKAIASAVDALVKKHPNLAKNGSRPAPLPGGARETSKSGATMNDEIRRLAGRGA